MEQVTNKEYSPSITTKAFNSLKESGHATFTNRDETAEYKIFYNRRLVRTGQTTTKHEHFYWVQSADSRSDPLIPTVTDFWQCRFDTYKDRFKPCESKKRTHAQIEQTEQSPSSTTVPKQPDNSPVTVDQVIQSIELIDSVNSRSRPESTDADSSANKKGPKKKRLRGRRKVLMIQDILRAKLVANAKVARDIGAQQYSERLALIRKGIIATPFRETRKKENLELLMSRMNNAPVINARMREKGVDISPRLRGKMPVVDVKKILGHEDDLDREIAYRQIPAWLPYGAGRAKRVHPVPEAEVEHTYKRSDRPNEDIYRFKPVSFSKALTFTQKLHLIMVDEERLHCMEGPWSDDIKRL
jgi:hypothetical protein